MDFGELIELLLRALPYADQMRNIDFGTTADTAIVSFDWRGTRYRLDGQGCIYEVDGICLVGSDRAILMQQLINAARAFRAACPRKAAA